ncbi:MAG: single-stranded DNA-binding protein [Bacteroidales bacterium]|jgi:single-strand DNA-binding protein|nr:single-stranded DNA-binding protein [Bacteroidales bacterium]HPH52798.1 single-stranded DNA-binding protein [Bacteroidales bacterium]
MALNKVLLIGNVGRDPEIRHLEGGASVASFSLATTERFKDRSGETREITEWHNIVAWRQLADLAGRFIKKGSQIYVEGRIRSRSWDDASGQKRYITEILADSIQLLGRRDDTLPREGAWDESAGTPRQTEPKTPTTKPTATPASQPAPQSEQFVSSDDLISDGPDDLPF